MSSAQIILSTHAPRRGASHLQKLSLIDATLNKYPPILEIVAMPCPEFRISKTIDGDQDEIGQRANRMSHDDPTQEKQERMRVMRENEKYATKMREK